MCRSIFGECDWMKWHSFWQRVNHASTHYRKPTTNSHLISPGKRQKVVMIVFFMFILIEYSTKSVFHFSCCSEQNIGSRCSERQVRVKRVMMGKKSPNLSFYLSLKNVERGKSWTKVEQQQQKQYRLFIVFVFKWHSLSCEIRATNIFACCSFS